MEPRAEHPPDRDWIERSNAVSLSHLQRQARTSLGVVPFLGAGVSTAYGLKDWKSLLLGAAPPRAMNQVEDQLREGKYEEAAETLLATLGEDGFQHMVAASVGDHLLGLHDFRTGTVSHLPSLGPGPVVTTNFDRILEMAYKANGHPFEQVISGPRPDLIVDALHGNRRVLIKLHGDWQDRVGRTFARSDYDANYGDAQPEKKRQLLDAAEKLLFYGRSILFIGASLTQDRTVDILKEVKNKHAGIRHYALMKVPEDQGGLEKLESHLASCSVMPIWYFVDKPDEHAGKVDELLASIVEGISTKSILPPRKRDKPIQVTAPIPAGNPEAVPGTMYPHFDRVTKLIEDGRLTFFLGAAVNSSQGLHAKGFYRELARIFECEALEEDHFAVAQYIADRFGRESLYREIRKLFSRISLQPGMTHHFLSSWNEYQTVSGERLPYPTILTTNYDDVLERQIEESGHPYHLLVYQAEDPYRGRFCHRGIDGSLRIIERPENIRRFDPGFVIVKLNGGFDRQKLIPESYVTARLDFLNLAARIPDVLPQAIRSMLTGNHLLFLGSSLRAPDIESVIRFAHKGSPGPRSWAVALSLPKVEYWRQCGVEILDHPVDHYVGWLHAWLGNLGHKTWRD